MPLTRFILQERSLPIRILYPVCERSRQWQNFRSLDDLIVAYQFGRLRFREHPMSLSSAP